MVFQLLHANRGRWNSSLLLIRSSNYLQDVTFPELTPCPEEGVSIGQHVIAVLTAVHPPSESRPRGGVIRFRPLGPTDIPAYVQTMKGPGVTQSDILPEKGNGVMGS